MYVVVAGGGKVGYYLAKDLINEGHEVLIIERDRRKVERINEELGTVAVRGDACEASVLAETGTPRADVVVAVTGDDEDNLVVCQMAKTKFNVPRAIARINNPKNEHIFRLLGIDATVSSTQLIMSQIEHELPPHHALVHLLRLRHANVEAIEATIAAGSSLIGKPLRDLHLPPDCIISLVVRDGRVIIPTGQTAFAAGDEVVALTTLERDAVLRRALEQ
jgi:trk system potassium uptake protein TrkA